jgi:mannose-6-phosphate isomerase-like protein (cupin superfamily)
VTARVADYRGFAVDETAALGSKVRVTVTIDDDARYLRQEFLEITPGRTLSREAGDLESLLFVVSGTGSLTFAGSHVLVGGTAARVPPNQDYKLAAGDSEPLLVVCVLVRGRARAPRAQQPVTISLADQQSDAATASREYRMLFGPPSGCTSATQFVGYIPPGRAPDHYHEYDEVIFVLEGTGVVHIGADSTPAAFGTCIRLPARVIHSVENVGTEPMSVLGVFCPAGSPAAAFYPDGTPALSSASHG